MDYKPIIFGCAHESGALNDGLTAVDSAKAKGIKSIGIEREIDEETYLRVFKSALKNPTLNEELREIFTKSSDLFRTGKLQIKPFFGAIRDYALKNGLEVHYLEGKIAWETALKKALEHINKNWQKDFRKKVWKYGLFNTINLSVQKSFPANYVIKNLRDDQMLRFARQKKPGAIFVGFGHGLIMSKKFGVPVLWITDPENPFLPRTILRRKLLEKKIAVLRFGHKVKRKIGRHFAK